MNTNTQQIIDAMSQFAADTKDDRLSCAVARVANRLAHQGHGFEKPLTESELRIIDMFATKLTMVVPA